MNCHVDTNLIPESSEIEELAPGVCPVDWAKQSIRKAMLENCGKSVMCRDGMLQLHALMHDITTGKGVSDDLALIKDICQVIVESRGCDLASKAASNLLYSMERYAEDWDLHCRRKRCAALVCKSYYSLVILPDKCRGAGRCIAACQYDAISGGKGLISVIDEKKCTRCGDCLTVCPNQAIEKAGAVKPKTPETPVPVGSFEGAGGGRRRRRR